MVKQDFQLPNTSIFISLKANFGFASLESVGIKTANLISGIIFSRNTTRRHSSSSCQPNPPGLVHDALEIWIAGVAERMKVNFNDWSQTMIWLAAVHLNSLLLFTLLLLIYSVCSCQANANIAPLVHTKIQIRYRISGCHWYSFRVRLGCKDGTLSNLPEIQQSLPASALFSSVQFSYKQSLEHWNLQAWCSS